MKAIEANGLGKIFDGNKIALKNSSFSIGQGVIFGFLGPNGAGKTTTIRLLNGILTPTSGSGTLFGKDIVKDRIEIHKLCGVMTETALMYENLSGLENLLFFGKLHGMSEKASRERSVGLLHTLELEDAGERKVRNYSTGMKRRLSLARALLHSPKILFLDEPTSGLDPESAMNVTRMIKELSQENGVTVFLCTHQLKYAEEICSLYGFIHEGEMIAMGTFDELLKQRNSSRYVELRGENLPEFDRVSGFGEKVPERMVDGSWRMRIHDDGEVHEILQTTMNLGGRIYEAKQAKWSLEDLYFSFLKEERP